MLDQSMQTQTQVQPPARKPSAPGVVIQTMIEQLGGRGIRGAFAYIGASQIRFKQRADDGYPDASKIREDGWADFQTGLLFRVNGKRSETWKMLVTYEPSDTYTVRLFKLSGMSTAIKTGKAAELLDAVDDVYCEELQHIVEMMYDDAIKQYNGGVINLD